jgi:glutathione-regulated potassium-efflux system protein KefB
VRETFHSAMAFGQAALAQLGVPDEEAAAIAAEVRRRDGERLQLEIAGGLAAGATMIQGNAPKPTPFTPPKVTPVRPAKSASSSSPPVPAPPTPSPA